MHDSAANASTDDIQPPSFAAWLKERRKAQDLTQEELADRVGCSRDYIRKMELGQRRPSKQVAELLAADFGVPPARWLAFVRWARTDGMGYLRTSNSPPLHLVETSASDQSTLVQFPTPAEDSEIIATPTNPYKGLRPFLEADAPYFFGRDALVDQLVTRLSEQTEFSHFLAVVGPSGSGKSSVVRAGLMPRLRAVGLPGGLSPIFADATPGTHPLREVNAALLRSVSLAEPSANMRPETQASLDCEHGLPETARQLLTGREGAGLFLLIDQFEETFTLTADEATRAAFLNAIYSAVSDPGSNNPLWIIVTLRADFYDRPLVYPDISRVIGKRTEVVTTFTRAELRSTILGPAERARLQLEPTLVAAIEQDVGEQPGTLPLMEYALTELFEQRTGPLLTLKAYEASGGLTSALARRAEAIYAGLTPDEQREAKQLFLRLVSIGEEGESTRWRVLRSELVSAASDEVALDQVLDLFGEHRLLTFDRDRRSGRPTVEVAHEALIGTWGRLNEWLDESREDLRIQRQLLRAAMEWEGAAKDRSFLVTGARLVQFEALAQGRNRPGGVTLTQEERAYLRASIEERQRQERNEQERQAKELVLHKRAANRLRVIVGGLALFLIMAIILSGFAVSQSQMAQDNAARADHSAATAIANQKEANSQRGLAVQSQATAEANYQRAEAQRLGGEANTLLKQGSSAETIALLSIRSMLTNYSPQGDAALNQASTLAYPYLMFAGHTDIVYSVAFSPDRQYVLTGSADGTAKLWDVQTGHEVRTFTGHTEFVGSVAVSPDGEYVLTASGDESARLWNAQTGQEVRSFLGHVGVVRFAVFSPDGKYVLTGGQDQTARLWDAKTGKEVHRFVGHSAPVIAGAFSPDGKYLLTGSRDYTARIWDLQTGAELHSLTHENQVYAVSFSPDGRYAATVSVIGIVRIWDAQTAAELRQFRVDGVQQLSSFAFSPDGQTMLLGGSDYNVHLLDAQTGVELRRFTGFTSGVWSVAFSRDGKYVLAGSDDHTARMWDLEVPNGLPQFAGGTGGFIGVSVSFSPDGKYILSGGFSDGTAKLWDARTGQEVRALTGISGTSGYSEWSIFSPDGKYMLTSGNDDRLWDVQTGREVRTFVGAALGGVAFSPDGKYVFAGSGDGTAKLWDARTGDEVLSFPARDGQPLQGVAFSPDGRYVLAGSNDGLASLWDAGTGQEVRTFTGHQGPVIGVGFSPDGKYVLTGSLDNTARLWDTETASPVVTYTGHTGPVGYVAFSSDGKYVLTDGDDDTARMWDAQTGVELRRFAGHQGQGGVAFSPGGKYVLSAGRDGTARLWYADYHDTINYLCGKLLRDFSDDERKQFYIQDKNSTCPAK